MYKTIPFLILFFFISCKADKFKIRENKISDWEEIQAKKVLTILAENGPASYFIYKGRNMGYEYELLYQFAKDNDVRLHIKMVQNLDSIFNQLYNFEGDLIACNLTITPEREKKVRFTTPHLTSKQVLIQKKPDNWRKLSRKQLKDSLITELEDLKNKTIYVWNNSTHKTQIQKISDLLNLNLNIETFEGDVTTEEIIRMVNKGLIDYTIADENIAKINQIYCKNIDISLPLSNEESLAFAARLNSNNLIDTLNYWLLDRKNASTIAEVKRKYFKRKSLPNKANLVFSSTLDGQLSPYDELIKKESIKLGWDWRLISSIIYQESKFETYKVSWAGAFGIFQFMPSTAASYGISPSSSAEAQIKAGIRKLSKNFRQWIEIIPDTLEATYFTLATYNCGRGHVNDARRLAEERGLNNSKWFENVDSMILNLSKPKYYRSKVVRHGYMRGYETFEYIYEVIERFEEYKNAFPDYEK